MTKYWLSVVLASAQLAFAGVGFGADSSQPNEVRFGTDCFSRSDGNRDGRLTLEEARAATLRLLEQFDRDRDGSVTGFESTESARPWRERRFEERFVELDRDGDGSLTRPEMALLPQRWTLLDGDRDGRLTRSELKRIYLRGTGRAPRRHGLRGRWARWDSNRDARVTRSEALRGTESQFASRDRNRDGVLTREEARAFAVR